jgi:hypothetical protein
LTEDGGLFFLPLDYKLVKNRDSLVLKDSRSFTRIIPIPSPYKESTDQFLLWQAANTRFPPQVVYSDHNFDDTRLNFITGRFPLRSISIGYGNMLVLDSAGNLSVYNLEKLSAKADFSYTSPGANDAVFINNQYLVISRSTANNNSPFLFINYKTGETVGVPYNTQTGITVYAGNSGNIYAESVEQDGNKFKTVILGLSLTNVPVRIFEYQGEAVSLSITESAQTPAIACDNEGAFIFGEKTICFERTGGLPVKLVGCDKFFITLDSEGNVSWHDNKDGKTLAVFSLYPDHWKMTVKPDNIEISGELLYQ